MMEILCGLCAFIGFHKQFQAALKRQQKKNIWGFNHQQTPSAPTYYIAYSVMKLTQ